MRSRTLLAFTAAALLTLLPTQSASAAIAVYHDPDGDTTSRSDLRWVNVRNVGSDNLFEVRVGVSQVVLGDLLVVYVDRDLKDPGPELRMNAYVDSEWTLARVNTWREQGTIVSHCGRVTYSTSSTRPVAVWHATRRCLGIGKQVRVAAKVVDFGHGVDWAPAPRVFLDPVSSGA